MGLGTIYLLCFAGVVLFFFSGDRGVHDTPIHLLFSYILFTLFLTQQHGEDDVIYKETMVCDAGSHQHIISSASFIKPGTLQKYPPKVTGEDTLSMRDYPCKRHLYK